MFLAPLVAALMPATPTSADCPERQLSCGRQRPVVSDGVHPFENAEVGLRVTFPRGSAVCMARSGDAPRGFFAIYGPGPTCAERPERPAGFISMNVSFNALFYTRLEQATGDCGPLSADMRWRLGSRGLPFPGYRSMVCQSYDSKSGMVELSVHALAGPWQDFGPTRPKSRMAIYVAAMGTTPARLDADLARFRRVLAGTRIGLMR